jgi:Zn-dependent protease
MNWSFRIARIAGIDIKVHLTFFLILILGALPWGSRFGVTGALFGVGLILALFLCVTLHELGHGLAARFYGIPVREIILLPLGGVALLGRNPSKPLHELVIALAGPLVNVVIAVLLLLVTGAGVALGGLDSTTLMDANQPPSVGLLLIWLLQANIALVIFNMIPAFPLDGGRVLRAVLAMVMPAQRATAIATMIGQGLAVLLGVYGVLSGNFMLVLVAVFIFFGAGQENVEGQARTVLTTLRVGDAYNKYALTLQIGDRVSKVVDYILTSYQPDFAVLQGSALIGIVTRDDVLRAMASDPQDQFVTMIMRREVQRIDANASLDTARQQMSEQNNRVAAVYGGETYLGLLSLEDIAEAYAVLAFQQRQQELRATGA